MPPKVLWKETELLGTEPDKEATSYYRLAVFKLGLIPHSLLSKCGGRIDGSRIGFGLRCVLTGWSSDRVGRWSFS